MAKLRTLEDLPLKGRRILVRLDLNLPIEQGEVTDATRIERSLDTVRDIAGAGARVVILSHLGRPKGRREPSLSLRAVLPTLIRMTGRSIGFAEDCIGPEAKSAVDSLDDGQIVLLENVRFHAGEEKNDPGFVAELARLGDAYVNDAFSVAHRAHASTEGLAHRLPSAAGRAMQAEIEALNKALADPDRPVAALVGGAKISTKLDLLKNLVSKVDLLILGGGMANTFLNAAGIDLGRSLCERDMAEAARSIGRTAEANHCRILLPTDGLIAREFAPEQPYRGSPIRDVPQDFMVLDIGEDSIQAITDALKDCRTILWNGPLGAFELPPFDSGTVAVARWVAERTDAGKLTSVAGGGDTMAALNKAGAAERFSYVSTAGGAFLEWLEGRSLPGVAVLMDEAEAA